MKLNLLKLGIIAAIFSIFMGCEKNENPAVDLNPQTKDKLYVVENSMLVFETPDDYDLLLEKWSNVDFEIILTEQQEAGFSSMYAVYAEKNDLDNLPADDIFFPLILSPEAKIKIGDYVFSFDFKTETLKAHKNGEKNAESFSFDHEVLPYLFDGEPLVKGDYCDGKRRATDVSGQEGWTRYYRAGIYYSLYAQFNVDKKFYGRMHSVGQFKWKNKKSSYYSYGDFNVAGQFGKLYYSMYKKRFRLKGYHAEVMFIDETRDKEDDVLNQCNQ